MAEHEPATRTVALIVAFASVSYAIQHANGHFAARSMVWLTVGLLFVLAAAAGGSLQFIEKHGEKWVPALAGSWVLISQLMLLYHRPPALQLPADHSRLELVAGVWLSIILSIAMLKEGRHRRAVFPVLLAIHFALGVWVIDAVPQPSTDVYTVQTEALHTLLRGDNPYEMTSPNIYGHTDYYPPNIVHDGRIQVGFWYPPLSLLLTIPGHLFGDFRYAQLAAITAAGALLALTRWNTTSIAGALMFLFIPRYLFVIEQGWTEPFAIVCFAAVIACHARNKRWMFLFLGLFFAVKQHLAITAPLAVLLLPRPFNPRATASLIFKAALVGAIVTLPFILWNPTAFWQAVFDFHLHTPFRRDGLTFAAWAARGNSQLPGWLGFASVALTTILALWRLPRNAAGYSTGLALVLLIFFAFSKQAFCNYYVLGLACLAGAISTAPSKINIRGSIPAEPR